ncbi:putative intracellular protease/amidase [Sinobaca qinghaiensis]|uniref:Putative intracellular protease/amidase n=1 Tax=Sinobaca qinghaiensis TaxID=342944 RepID=A0A419V8L3_9BACL|nr:type 1 glutamine amidotransferase family protein [Sinobaca qinghaiensis]RKD76397.1 putative intracellular protease/amidase [Sinobaca qinghaiensis]
MRIKNVYLYVLDTMADWEYGYLTAELNTGRCFKKDIMPLKVITAGADKEKVTTMGGVSIQPELSFDECSFERDSLFILPGGDTWGEEIHEPVLRKVGEAMEAGAVIAAICGATVGLARMGYLDTKRHTSNDLEYLQMVCPDYKGEALYETEPAVTDGNVITASGIAPLEFAREVLKKLDVFTPDTLDAWYHLNKTHRPEYYYQLMKATS